MKLAFIGLGTMGYPMAGHLQKNNHNVTVFNRSSSKTEQWQNEYHGDIASTPKQAVNDADIVMLCVGNDDDLREICFGEQGVLAGLASNAILVDHTTTSATVAKEVAHACDQQGNSFLDAPVSGGEIGAVNGQLTVMVGGETKVFEQAKPVLTCYAKKLAHLGPVGAGQTCKMVNQLCIAGILQGLAEGLTLAQESNLDLVQVRDVLKHGAAQSWQLEQRAQTIAEDKFDFGFAVDWMRKDLAICLQSAKKLGLELPLAEMVDQSYAELQQQGHSRSDTSVLVKSVKT
jgi:3-hydroxyisobutyrate dehydrogenase